MVVEPPENPTFSTKKEKYGGGISKNESKVGFSGGASAGVPAQVAGLSFSHSARNRFEFRCTKEPYRTKSRRDRLESILTPVMGVILVGLVIVILHIPKSPYLNRYFELLPVLIWCT